MNYKNVLLELYSIESPEFKLGLKRIKELLSKLDNPERKLKCVHVAGTNGKGSVCAMISSILINAGHKVGMYTSPHLKKFNERIRINDRLITDKEIVEYYLRVKKYATNQSFFEITTAMAFLYFFEKKVDFAVLEVGLGGRLDATNVVRPLISVISNVDYEHTDILGNNLRKIAYEKASIIKNNIPTVTGAEGIALETIKKFANKKDSQLFIIDHGINAKINNKNRNDSTKVNIKDNSNKNNKQAINVNIKIKNNNKFVNNNKKIDNNFDKNNDSNKLMKNNYAKNKKYNGINKIWSFDFENYKKLSLNNLRGEFQINNSLLAIKAIDVLNKKYKIRIDKNSIKNGLKNAKWPGRFQFIGKNVLADCAHNLNGFKILFNELKYLSYNKLIAIVGFLKDKDARKISKIVNKKAHIIILTKPNSERAAKPEMIKKFFKKKSLIIDNTKKALSYAKKISGKKDLILVAGSIYIVGEVMKWNSI